MSERYERLYTLPQNLYSQGSPVVIAAGALLRDNLNNRCLAQLKYANIAKKSIVSITVCLTAHDAAGTVLQEVHYRYENLIAKPNTEFGQKTPIEFSNNTTTSFSVEVENVVFNDGSMWRAGEGSPFTQENKRSVETISIAKQSKLKNIAVLPTIICVLGIVLYIISLSVLHSGSDHAGMTIGYAIRNGIIYFILAFVLPVAGILLTRIKITAQIIKPAVIASCILIGIQCFGSIIYIVSLLAGFNEMASFVAVIPGAELLRYVHSLFIGFSASYIWIGVLSELCFIGKNILCLFIFKNLMPKTKRKR